MLVNIYKKYQKTNLYIKQCELRSRRRFKWLTKNYNKLDSKSEIKELIDYLENNNETEVYTDQIYGQFCSEYEYVTNDIIYDDEKKMYYACGKDTNGRRLYFPRFMDKKEDVVKYYKQLCIEQNVDSPHCYLSKSFNVDGNDIILDIGAAEGNFSLSIIDRAKKVYLFECDKEWMEALNYTFEPYKDKVEIVNKYVGNQNQGMMISIDYFLKEKEEHTYVLKMDIEGAEMEALSGAVESIQLGKIKKIMVCAYHNQDDERNIRKFFSPYTYHIETAHGFITKMADLFAKKPYIRRGVLRISRSS